MIYFHFAQLRVNSLSRKLVMLLVLLASVLLSLALNSSEGWAQTTVSPLATPASQPVPVTESLAPPTNSPPADLVAWPTPAPTPFPSAVQQALDFLADAEDLSAANLIPLINQVVNDPADDTAQFIAVQLLDEESRQFYWVLVSQENGAEFPADYSEETLELLAAEADLEVDDLQPVAADYRLYPFAEQLIWIGEAFTGEGETLTLALDLAGEPVDLEEIEATEAEIRVIACEPIADELCTALRLGGVNGAPVLITALTDDALASVTELLEEEEFEFEENARTVTAQIPAWLIMEIAALEDIGAIERDTSDLLLPLDSHLVLDLREVDGEFTLHLTSTKWYPRFEHRLEATGSQAPLTATRATSTAVEIEGLAQVGLAPDGGGVATAEIPLGELFGIHNLTISYVDDSGELALEDRYGIIVTGERVLIRSHEISFTWPIYNTWLRLPEDAIWFVAQSRAADDAADLEEYEEAVDLFYEVIEALGADPLALQEGVYTHQLFIPPWESWQEADGDLVQVSLNHEVAYLFKWPDIRYFTYSEDLDSILEIMQASCTEEIAITAYTAAGEKVECEP
jgi:hypothetical protein